MATVKDIAELTGFSAATISRVLNQDDSFSTSEETKKKIFQCAKELNYEIKNKSHDLGKRKLSEYHVGVIPIGLESTGRGELQDPYYLYIRNGVEERLDQVGISNVKTITLNQKQDYEKLDDLDGMIVIGKKTFDIQNLYFRKLRHVVFIDYDFDHQHYDCVLSDFKEAAKMALDFLRERGYRSIGYIGSWDYVNDFGAGKMIRQMDIRQRAYEEYLREHEMDWQRYCYVGEKFTAAVGYELAVKAIRSRELAEAFLIGSDPMALGVYRAFGDYGIEIGKDIGLISIDGIANANYMSPPLATVKVNSFYMGRTAVDCLVQQIEGRKYPVKIYLPMEVVEGASCSST